MPLGACIGYSLFILKNINSLDVIKGNHIVNKVLDYYISKYIYKIIQIVEFTYRSDVLMKKFDQ